MTNTNSLHTTMDAIDETYLALIRDGRFTEALDLRRERKRLIANRLVSSNGGAVFGIEAANESGTLWGAILPAMSGENGPVRILYYASNGFSGHVVYRSEEEALSELINGGLIVPDIGAMDRLQLTDSWKEGMEALHRLDILKASIVALDRQGGVG